MSPTTGKQKASRIPLDYYKKPDRMGRMKRRLTWAATGLTVLWMASMLIGGTSFIGATRFSHGPVCVAHSAIENDCASCHISFAMFAEKKEMNAKCQKCHFPSSQDSHHLQKAEMTPNCGECHTDHKGRDYNLKQNGDAQCVLCHKSLSAALDGKSESTYKDLTNFNKDHPEFKLFREKEGDPSKIRFNHKYHMTKGIVLAADGKPFTVDDIHPDHRENFRNNLKNSDPVQLVCANCHKASENSDPVSRRDRPDPATNRKEWEQWSLDYFKKRQDIREPVPNGDGARMPRRDPGKYMPEINYNAHCSGCHRLSFDPGLSMEVNHRQQPDKLREQLTEIYTDNLRNPKLLTMPGSIVGLPGKGFSPPTEKDMINVNEKVEEAMRLLLNGKRACGECHMEESGKLLSSSSQKIAVPNIPKVWFTHSNFNHAKHVVEKNIDCAECHKSAYADKDPVKAEQEVLEAYNLPRKGAENVMIEGIASCQKCHASSPEPDIENRGLKAGAFCTECHSYHHGLIPASTPTARREDGEETLSAWLRPRKK